MRAPLSRAVIIDACLVLIERNGADAFSMRLLGTHLEVDPTAMYRHFRNKDELLRAVGDRIHASVLVDLPARGGWRRIVREICIRLRAAHLAHPELASLVRTGPPMHNNEFALTEAMLHQLRRGGLKPRDATLAYHALIELTVASAAIDAPLAAKSVAERSATYRLWRAAYASLDPELYPESVALAAHLYATSADDRFAYALDCLLAGIQPA